MRGDLKLNWYFLDTTPTLSKSYSIFFSKVVKGYLLDTQLVLTHAVTPLIWADREVIWHCRWLFYYHTLLCFLNVSKNLLFQKKLWPNRFPSKHGKLTFDGERYSQKNFFDFKVCFSYFLKAKMECDRLISPVL